MKKTVSNRFLTRFAESYRYNRRAVLWCAFLIPFTLMLLIYLAMSVFPFGRFSVLTLDLNGQYVYFFEALRDWVYGEGSLLYSFSRALGGEFMGIYAYYLASPLSYIVVLFPKGMITEALFLMLLVKCGLCGLTFAIFLRKVTHAKQENTILFSTLYALSSYAIVMQHNTMWTDCLILLPLLTLGLYSLIREGKFKLFTLTLALSILSNFYIGYMMCLYTFCMFFALYFSIGKRERKAYGKHTRFLRALSRCALFSAIAVLMAAVIILPAYYSLSFGKNEFSDPSFGFSVKFNLLDMVVKLFFGSYDTVRPEGLPFLYCGTIVLFLLPLYFLAKRIPLREKIVSIFLILVFTFSFNINTLNLIWHGFQNPNWLNYRESFMLIFILLVMSSRAFGELKDVRRSVLLAIASTLIGLLLLMLFFGYDFLNPYYSILAGIGIVVGYTLILLAFRKKKAFSALFLAIAVFAETYGGGLLNIAELSDDVGFATRASYVDFMKHWQAPVDRIKASDDGFYRMEKSVTRKVNDPFALGYNGLSGSTSTLNAETIEFLHHLGLCSQSHWSQYVKTGDPAVNALLSLKYLLVESGDPISPLYTEIFEDNDVVAYKNPYAFSLFTPSGEDVKRLTFRETKADESQLKDDKIRVYTTSPFEKINALYSVLSGEQVELYRGLRHDAVTTTNTTQAIVAGHTKYARGTNQTDASSVTYHLHATRDGEIYFYFPSLYQREVSLSLNGEAFGTYFTNGTHAITYLGAFQKGDTITLSMTLEEDDLYIGTVANYFYSLDEEVFRSVAGTLAANGGAITEHSATSFHFTVVGSEDKPVMFTTIPYDKGWQVSVDGQIVPTFELVDALLGFDLPAGEHTVTLRYAPRAFAAGCGISAVGSLLFVGISAADLCIRKRKRISPSDATRPET